jgi:hypothetical protein
MIPGREHAASSRRCATGRAHAPAYQAAGAFGRSSAAIQDEAGCAPRLTGGVRAAATRGRGCRVGAGLHAPAVSAATRHCDAPDGGPHARAPRPARAVAPPPELAVITADRRALRSAVSFPTRHRDPCRDEGKCPQVHGRYTGGTWRDCPASYPGRRSPGTRAPSPGAGLASYSKIVQDRDGSLIARLPWYCPVSAGTA